MRLAPYDSYKPNKGGWFRSLPYHWGFPRLKQVSRINPSSNEISGLDLADSVAFLPMDVVSVDGRISRLEYKPLSEASKGFTYMADGDVCIAKITPCFENGKGAVAQRLPNGFAFGSTEFHVFRPSDSILATYLYHTLNSGGFRIFGESNMQGSAGQKRVQTEFIANVRLPLPPLEEQDTIVRFIRHIDLRVNKLIKAKKRLIDLLNEQKQAIIHDAVTKGLDPTVPMKDSGIEWLGQIPEHWDVNRVKTVFKLRTEFSGKNHDLELLSIYTHIGVRPRKDLEQKGNRASTTDNYWIVKKGDLIVNKLLAWMGAVGVSDFEGVTSPAYDILKPIREVDSFYYHCLFRTSLYLQQFKKGSRGIMEMRLRLYFDQLGQIPIPIPPIREQREIVDEIKSSTFGIDLAISKTQSEIDLIREYRTRLVSDVVTGQLDVRGLDIPEIEEEIPDYDLDVDEEAEDSEELEEALA